jgi:hypothetical protein
MFRVEIGGVEREVPDIATLQQLLDRGEISPTTPVWVEAGGELVQAQTILGLALPPVEASDDSTPPVIEQASYSSPRNMLVWAILSMILCCLPFGVVATVYAIQAETLARQGNGAEANLLAEKASRWIIYAVAGASALFICYIYLMRFAPRFANY